MGYLDGSGVTALWGRVAAAFAALSHSHSASDIASGTIAPARLPAATASERGAVVPDGTTITVSGGVISASGGGSYDTLTDAEFTAYMES